MTCPSSIMNTPTTSATGTAATSANAGPLSWQGTP